MIFTETPCCIMKWIVKSLLQNAAGSQISLLHFAEEKFDYLLHNVAGSQIYRCIMWQGVRSYRYKIQLDFATRSRIWRRGVKYNKIWNS